MRTRTTTLLLLCLALNCLGQHTNIIKFYLHPNLVTNLSFVRTNLAKYVSDMNYILAKNTGRVLSYNTNTGLILTNQQPHDQQEVLGGNPNTGYEIWVHAIQTTQSVSHGGYMSVDSTTGAGVLAGFNWTRVYNPDTITNGSPAFIDYRTQVSSMLHEFGHVFGGGAATGVGEYYNQVVVDDTTGVPPLVNIRAVTDPFSGEFNYQDIFWGLHADYAMDPLLRPAPATNRAHLLSLTVFSELSASIMYQNYRYSFFSPPPMTSLTGLRLLVTDDLTCLPLEGVTVKIWRIGQGISLTLLVNTVTGTNGEVIWDWNPQSEFVSTDPLRLIKLSRVGYETNAHYVSSIDLQEMAILDGHSTATNRLAMARPQLLLFTPSKGVVRVTNTVPNKTFKIEASTNFVNWIALVTNTPTSQAVFWYTNTTSLPHRFYRTVEAALDGCYSGQEMMIWQAPEENLVIQEPAQPSKKNTELPPLPEYIPLNKPTK